MLSDDWIDSLFDFLLEFDLEILLLFEVDWVQYTTEKTAFESLRHSFFFY